MIKLSQRLQRIADLVPNRGDTRIADIGSDHALLPVYMIQQGIAINAIAGEVAVGPWEAATAQVKEAKLEEKIEVRRGDGLAVIESGEVDTITIAGMGGSLIAQILTQGITKLNEVDTLILQPNVGEHRVRQWLLQHGWFLQAEELLEEDNHLYVILKAVRTKQVEQDNQLLYKEKKLCSGIVLNSEWVLRFGPYLLKDGSDLFIKKWLEEIKKLKKIHQQINHSTQPESYEKLKEVFKQIKTIEEVIDCLQKVK